MTSLRRRPGQLAPRREPPLKRLPLWMGRVIGDNPVSLLADAVGARLPRSAYEPLQAPPTLERPRVLFTGLTLEAASYREQLAHLESNPKNGRHAVYVPSTGELHRGGVDGPVLGPDEVRRTKIFVVQYSRPAAAPTAKRPEVERAMRDIAAGTRAKGLDVEAHSAACTDFRLYLHQRSGADRKVRVNNVAFVGPVTMGTTVGNVGAALGGPFGVAEAGRELSLISPLVTRLNRAWPSQLAQVEGKVTVIGSRGAPTLGHRGVVTGDGFVPAEELSLLHGADTVVFEGTDPTLCHHLKLIGYPGVINAVNAALSR